MSSLFVVENLRASARELGRVRPVPTLSARMVPPPATTKEPLSTLVAGLLVHRIGLSGEQGFVGLQPDRVQHRAVHDDLVAQLQFQHITQHDLARARADDLPVPIDQRFRLTHQRQPLEGPLGAPFLDDADRRVEDDDQAEERSPGSALARRSSGPTGSRSPG